MLENIPYNLGNLTDIDGQLTKTMYCGLETITYKGLQLWQQLPQKVKN